MTQATGDTQTDNSSRRRTEDSSDAGQRYRFARPALPVVLGDMRFGRGDPGPGDRVPGFDLPTVGGGRFLSSDLVETGPALLIFGSSTCPVTDNATPGLNELYLRFGDRVRFVMVNVREAHPGKTFPQPRTLETKMAHAERLRDLHGFEFEVAVDDLDGTLHRALSPKPNSAYVLGTDGTILFRAHWASDTKALAAARMPLWPANRRVVRRAAAWLGPCCACFATLHRSSTERAAAPGRTCGAWPPHWQPSPSRSRLFASARAGPDHP